MNNLGGFQTQIKTINRNFLDDWKALPFLATNEVAALLRVKPQTVRMWACYDTGPIKERPKKLHGKLLWRTSAVLELIQ